jgi:predicted DNA-binding mobile mystery protein A
MVAASDQLDRRFAELKPLARAAARPARGWIRAIREALGMTTGQLAKRMNARQPRIIELERGEVSGNITVQSLERAAEALGCRFVYALVPVKPLSETVQERAAQVAEKQLASVEQTMRLEAQGVNDKKLRQEARQHLIQELLRRPARLWDEP